MTPSNLNMPYAIRNASDDSIITWAATKELAEDQCAEVRNGNHDDNPRDAYWTVEGE